MSTLPPGPSFAPVQTLRFLRDAEAFFLDNQRRYGDPFRVNIAGQMALVTGTPEGIKEMFTADPDTFEPFSPKNLAGFIGPHSVILLAGQAHRRERKLLMPPFHGERMRAYGEVMQKAALAHTRGLRPGTPLLALSVGQDISLDVIIEAVFGVREPARMALFRQTLTTFTENMTGPLIFFQFLRRPLFGLSPWSRFQRAAAELDRLLDEQIAARRADAASHDDILSLLLSARDEDGQPLPDSDLKDELRTMLIAGHETTALGMAWALLYIHQHPKVKARLMDELATLGSEPAPDKLATLPYLEAICNESLRLHPVLPMAPRRVVRPFVLRGHSLSPGMAAIASVVLAHNNPETFPDPERFVPERFLDRRYSPFEYIPFGGGARRCLGAAFALYEMKIALGTIMAQHRFSLTSIRTPRVVRRNLTLAPEGGVPMIYEGSPGI